ncbi:acyltransferase family protein [Paractinoplanes hotanensis]|uniref:Acyltransferase n=1 Tax=Paractinoplanes hotanensis TaxID=2906497 RepID=A0ABT0XQV4_9ACTN|nr:acyltransferase [Actinoplanes hotanensis]MCM4076149.1 acyltransferase [Actinoplanes hotanensis]
MTATPVAGVPTAAAPPVAKPPRNRYIDTLRALAIVRVVVYHAFGWAWLTYVLPAMGVMFAIAGSLMAASLAKSGARKAVWSRIRRLLPALWTFAAVALPIMFWHGWSASDPDHPLHKLNLLFWLFPLEDPPGSSWGEPFWEVLWYLRAYLIFVLVSPILYFAYKKLGWVVVALPLAALAALHLTGFRLPDPIDGIMWDFVTYAACWIAGFAHRDGRLHRLPVAVWAALTAVLGGIGLYWLFTHPTAWGFDLNEEPIARTLWSLAFVLIVLRFRPALAVLDKVSFTWLSESVRVINARAITIYLWHFPLITVGAAVLEHYEVPWATFQYIVWMLVLETALVLVAVLLFGWVEDVSAKRKASLWPAAMPSLAGAGGPAMPAVAGAGGPAAAGAVFPRTPESVSPRTPEPPAAGSAVSPGYGSGVSVEFQGGTKPPAGTVYGSQASRVPGSGPENPPR